MSKNSNINELRLCFIFSLKKMRERIIWVSTIFSEICNRGAISLFERFSFLLSKKILRRSGGNL